MNGKKVVTLWLKRRMDILSEKIIDKVRQENCFDFLRYLFALSLILAHFCTATAHDQFWFITGSMRVKAFFTITGFLVTYSFLRRNKDIVSYSKKRFARIIPAYVVCILFCFLVGCLITSLPISEFFASGQTWKYLAAKMAMLNWLEPELPSTFQSNPLPEMNGSLWSMKQEVVFYILVPFLIWLMKGKRWRDVCCGLLVGLYVLVHNFVNVQTQYFMYFLTGMTLLLYFDKFCRWQRYLVPIAIVCLIPVYVVEIPSISYFCYAIEPLCFPTVIIGAAYNLRALNFLRKYENVTYGLYLYHFPIMQVLIYYGLADYSFWLCLLTTIVLTSILATMSWFWIEKPCINLKFKV